MPTLLQCIVVLALAGLGACLTADAPPPSPPSSSGPDEPPPTADDADEKVATQPGGELDLGPLPPLNIDPGLRKALLQALTKLEEEAQQQLAEEERKQGSAELVQTSASGVPGSAPASGPDSGLQVTSQGTSGPDSSLQVTSRGTSGTGGDFNYFTSPGGRPTAEARDQQPVSTSTTTTTTTTTSTTTAPPPAVPHNHRPESEPARPVDFISLPASPLPTAASLLAQPPSARSNAGEDIRSNVIPSSSSSAVSQQKPVVTSQVVKSVSTSLPSAPAATNNTNATRPEVAIFQAPLVAAFTLHHDLSGLPQSVEPLLEAPVASPGAFQQQLFASPVASPGAFQQQLFAVHQRHVFLKQQRQKIEELERQRQVLAQQRAEQERQRQVEEQQVRLQLELQRQRQLQQQQLLELHRMRQQLEAQRLRQQQQLELQLQREQQLQRQQQQQQVFLGQQQSFFPGRPTLQGFRSQRQEKPSATANPGLVDVLPSVGSELKPPPPPNNNNIINNNNVGQFRGFSPSLSQRLPAFLPTPASPQQQVRSQQQQQLQAGTSPVLTRQLPDSRGQQVLIQQSVPFSLPLQPQPQDVSFQQFPQLGGFQPGPVSFRPQRQQPPPAFGFRPQQYDTITPALQSLHRQQQQQQQFRQRPGLLQNNLLPNALREDIDIVSKVLSLNHQRRNGTAEEE